MCELVGREPCAFLLVLSMDFTLCEEGFSSEIINFQFKSG